MIRLAFNQTRMELKLDGGTAIENALEAFNQTRMELKLA